MFLEVTFRYTASAKKSFTSMTRRLVSSTFSLSLSLGTHCTICCHGQVQVDKKAATVERKSLKYHQKSWGKKKNIMKTTLKRLTPPPQKKKINKKSGSLEETL